MDRRSRLSRAFAFSTLAFALGCREVACPIGSSASLDAQGQVQCTVDPGASNGDSATSTTPPPTSPAPRAPTSIDFDLFKDVAYATGLEVDAQYPASRELLANRTPGSASEDPVDRCDASLDGRDTFADRIAAAVDGRMRATKPQISYVASFFGLASEATSYLETGLVSHALCPVSAASLNVTFQGKNVPAADVVAKADRFSKLINQHRQSMLNGEPGGRLKVERLWTKFMMCLGYMESLTTADDKSADAIASAYGFRRPAGVSLYMDPFQTLPESKFSIGIFQLSPDAGGIAQSCIREWNLLHPTCKVAPDASWTKMLWTLGSPLQTFNAFCGVGKITAMFGVQVNSKNSKNTHPSNVNANGSLKAPAQRCVSPFMNVNTSYNHFGPLQNVHGFTLNQVLSCTLQGESLGRRPEGNE